MMGKAIEASFDPNEISDNPLYANNAVAENDSSAGSGGTLTFTLDRLTQDAAADLYGLTKKTATVSVGGETVSGTGFDYLGDEQSAPVGVAFIRWNQLDNNRNNHEVVLYRNVTFSVPSESAKTMGESIEWQTPEISGTVVGKEGDGLNPWHQEYVFPTHAAAVAFIEEQFAEI